MAAEVVIDIVGKDNFSSTLGNFGNIMTGIKSTIDLVSGAFNAAVNMVTPFVEAAIESENAIAELEAVLKATGGAAGLTSEELQAMAGELQSITTFSDETIMAGQSMLLTFRNIGEDTFPRATEAMLDMATMFGSVDTAAVQLGKALNDPIAGVGALSRIGIQFTEEQKTMIANFMEMGDVASAQNIILKEVEMQIGGLAEAMGETFAGKMEILKNRLGEIQEVIGRALIPILEVAVDKFMEWLPIIEEFGGKIANLFEAIANAGVNSPEFREVFSDMFGVNTVDEILPKIDDFVANIINAIADSIDAWASGTGPDELSDRLVSFIDNLGTGGEIDSKAVQAMQRVFSALISAVGRIDWGEVGVAIDRSFSEWSINAGQALDDWDDQIVAGIRDGFINGLNQIDINAERWVDDHIINPIKRALGIASPSSVFMQIGRDIVSGLILGFGTMVGSLLTVISGIVDTVLSIFQPVLDILGIDTGGTTTGELGGRSTGTAPGSPTGTTTTSTGTAGSVVNNFYGNVYFGDMGQLGYDCPSPHPLMAASANSVLNLNVG
jgi:spore maturation protein SpmB